MLLIVGLGNVGSGYKNTYHNMGFMVADKLSELMGLKFNHSMCKASVAISKDKEIIIAKPETFMNLSGESVKRLLKKFNLTPEDMIVIYDDIDIPKGKIRVRDIGSAGTHNGMRNILSCILNPEFVRVRIGIGRDSDNQLSDYVLSKMNRLDLEILLPTVEKAAKAIMKYITDRDIDALKRENN